MFPIRLFLDPPIISGPSFITSRSFTVWLARDTNPYWYGVAIACVQ